MIMMMMIIIIIIATHGTRDLTHKLHVFKLLPEDGQ